MVEEFESYFLGGVDDMASWSQRLWHDTIDMLENGTEWVTDSMQQSLIYIYHPWPRCRKWVPGRIYSLNTLSAIFFFFWGGGVWWYFIESNKTFYKSMKWSLSLTQIKQHFSPCCSYKQMLLWLPFSIKFVIHTRYRMNISLAFVILNNFLLQRTQIWKFGMMTICNVCKILGGLMLLNCAILSTVFVMYPITQSTSTAPGVWHPPSPCQGDGGHHCEVSGARSTSMAWTSRM